MQYSTRHISSRQRPNVPSHVAATHCQTVSAEMQKCWPILPRTRTSGKKTSQILQLAHIRLQLRFINPHMTLPSNRRRSFKRPSWAALQGHPGCCLALLACIILKFTLYMYCFLRFICLRRSGVKTLHCSQLLGLQSFPPWRKSVLRARLNY